MIGEGHRGAILESLLTKIRMITRKLYQRPKANRTRTDFFKAQSN
jgi:hypothetical protein